MNSTPANQEFTLLLTRHQTSLYSYILSLIADRNAAEEILQETNVTLLQKSETFTADSNFLAWACTIARYKVLHARRSFAKDRLRLSETVIEQVAARLEGQTSVIDDRRLALRHCLDKLREQDQQLLQQRYQAGNSVQHLADATGNTTAATSQKLYRIRGQLLECVQATMRRDS